MEQSAKKRMVSEIIEPGDRVVIVDVSDLPPEWKLTTGMKGTVDHNHRTKGSHITVAYVDVPACPARRKFLDSKLIPLAHSRLELE